MTQDKFIVTDALGINRDDIYIRSRILPKPLTGHKTPKKTPPNTTSKMTGLYKGEELKDYEGRPGSMDAFKLPSIHNGKRIPATRISLKI